MRCHHCKGAFVPERFLQKYCSKSCENEMKKEPKKPKAKKPKQKKLQTLLKDFEKVFNAWIRKRDNGKPCISCDKYNELQAGHFWAVQGYKALRFDEDNVHGECASCNCYDESHLIRYSINLKNKIGEVDYNDLIGRAELYKSGKLNNEYYKNGKWDRDAIVSGIEYYSELLKD